MCRWRSGAKRGKVCEYCKKGYYFDYERRTANNAILVGKRFWLWEYPCLSVAGSLADELKAQS
jgi:hypothetical protein